MEGIAVVGLDLGKNVFQVPTSVLMASWWFGGRPVEVRADVFLVAGAV